MSKPEDLVAKVNNYCYLADTSRTSALKNKYKKLAEEAQGHLDSASPEHNSSSPSESRRKA